MSVSQRTAPTTEAARSRARMWVKVARMYHEERMGQPEIADRLNLSQSQVSRLLKEAQDNGVVRTVVLTPPGLFAEIEEALRDRFDLRDAVVADAPEGDDRTSVSAMGIAAATYLGSTLGRGERIGISSRSAALLAMVETMTPVRPADVDTVVQSLGAVGNSAMRAQASGLTAALARLTGAHPVFLATPGVVTRPAVRDGLLEDEHISAVATAWRDLTTILTGIGALDAPQPSGGSALLEADVARLSGRGAVGDVCLNFFDTSGRAIDDELRTRVIGISEEEIRAVPRRIAVAGGSHKAVAIAAACRGGWVNVLVTDYPTARRLLEL